MLNQISCSLPSSGYRVAKKRQHKFPPTTELSIINKLTVISILIGHSFLANCDSSSWLSLAPREISKSDLNFDNRELRSIPKFELCEEQELKTTTTTNKRFIHVLSLANNQITELESGAFVCVASTLKILILRYNEIERIDSLAFRQLSSLQVLLLDNNQLTSIPTKESLRPLKSMRHLNLANNRIEWLQSDSFAEENVNLISLNLKGNPLHQIRSDSLWRLVKLKTLMLSESALGGQLVALDGLSELRFYHLDRAKDLRSISPNLCHSSRNLTTLVLAANQLEEIPQFHHCQNLLLLDLSYNQISGSLSENFLNQPNLIDLYLGHNHIELIDERAFVGLIKLQVLELNNNKLKQIHPQAFLPLRVTIYDLNLSNNHRLSSLSSAIGLEFLVSFKSYGNEQLRELPFFQSAASLALTYAYHCCDYLSPNLTGAKSSDDLQQQRTSQIAASDSTLEFEQKSFPQSGTKSGAQAEFVGSIYAKFKSLFLSEQGSVTTATTTTPSDTQTKTRLLEARRSKNNSQAPPRSDFSTNLKHLAARPGSELGAEGSEMTQNLSEIILWPANVLLNSTGRSPSTGSGSGGDNGVSLIEDQPPNFSPQFSLSPRLPRDELVNWRRGPSGMGPWIEAGGGYKRRRRNYDEEGASRLQTKDELLLDQQEQSVELDVRLIDELVWWQVEKIRRLHSVQMPFNLPVRYTETAEKQEDYKQASYMRNMASLDEETEEADEVIIMDDAIKFLIPNDKKFNFFTRKLNNVSGREKSERRKVRHLMIEETTISETKSPTKTKGLLDFVSSKQEKGQTRIGTEKVDGQSIRCLPQPSAFFPCQDLFDTWWLRLGIWCVFFLSFTGNISVIIVLGSVKPSSSASALTSIMWLTHSKRHIDVPRFLVINLAIADLLMALYLGILAFVDLSTLGEFKLFAIKWQYSTGCKLAGFLGVLSSELSVFILAIITLERNYAITNAVHLNRRLSLQKAMIIMLLGYAFALIMALMPLNGISDYRKFSICLPLDVESNLSSQVYVITLIGINTFSFILLLSCYLRMYCAIRGSQAWNTNDLRIAKRMSILVITDFLCWMPIILVAVTSLFGYHLIGTKGLKILTIFILPLNSVANPFLYAITTKKFKRDLDTLILRARSSFAAINHCSNNKFSSPHINSPKLNNHQTNNNACYIKSCKDKIFVDYNQQYQHNLIMMNRKKDKKNKIRKDIEQAKQQQHQQHQPTAGRRIFLFDQQQRGALTGNQVTINKTTCSCQRIMSPTQVEDSDKPRQQAQDTIEQPTIVQFNQQQQQNRTHVQPRIVLDSVETNVPLITKSSVLKSKSTNLIPLTIGPNHNPHLIHSNLVLSSAKTPLLIQGRDLKASSAGALQQNQQLNQDDRILYRFCVKPHNSLRDPTGDEFFNPSHQQTSLRTTPTLDGVRGTSGESSSPYNNNDRGPVHQCSGVSIGAHDIQETRRYLLVADPQHQLEQDRSVSACGYRRHQLAGNSLLDLDESSHRQVSGSCDMMQQRVTCGLTGRRVVVGEKSSLNVCDGRQQAACKSRGSYSRSINRLLFDPIAKAWSSIALSLSSSTTQVLPNQSNTIEPIKQAQTVKSNGSRTTKSNLNVAGGTSSSNSYTHSNKINSSETSAQDTETTTSNAPIYKRYFNDYSQAHLLMDDILLMSSGGPSTSTSSTHHHQHNQRHLFKLNERRMSRSCDLISLSTSSSSNKATNRKGKKHENLLAGSSGTPTSTYGDTNQTSTTTNNSIFCDYDDDQRILLATLNSMVAGKDKHGISRSDNYSNILMGKKLTTTSTQSTKYVRSNSTRCRSWSPALLNKLEDCIHQIKFKLPTFGTSRPGECGPNHHNHDYETHESDTNSRSTTDEEDEAEACVAELGYDERLGRCFARANVDEEEEEEEEEVTNEVGDEDEFNETALLDWTERKTRRTNKLGQRNYNQIRAKDLSGSSTADKRKRLRRQQSSTNSDTMSTRTGATILTNISGSFDSTLGIPAQTQPEQEKYQISSSVLVDENKSLTSIDG